MIDLKFTIVSLSKWDKEFMIGAQLFFYLADEGGNALDVNLNAHKGSLLASGSRSDIGDWQLHLKSMDDVELHYCGFYTLNFHNLSDLVEENLASRIKKHGLQLSDSSVDSPNVLVFQIIGGFPFTTDIVLISGTSSESSRIEERVNFLTGTSLTNQLKDKERSFDEKFEKIFNLTEKVDSESVTVGKAAIGNLLGGIGYFYGQSKIALPRIPDKAFLPLCEIRVWSGCFLILQQGNWMGFSVSFGFLVGSVPSNEFATPRKEIQWLVFVFSGIFVCVVVYRLTAIFSSLFLKGYGKLSKAQKMEWNNRGFSTFHAIFALFASFYLLILSNIFNKDSHKELVINRSSTLSNSVLAESGQFYDKQKLELFRLKYFKNELPSFYIYRLFSSRSDDMILWNFPALGGLEYVLHHLLSLFSIIQSLLSGQGQIYILMILFTESTTPFVNLRWHLDVAGLKSSKLYIWNGIALFFGWLQGFSCSCQEDLPNGFLQLACGASYVGNDEHILVLEDCQGNGTLYDALHGDDERRIKLSWNARICVALGAASALDYHLSGRLLTAYGYSAPEFESGSYTQQSDVFSFGVVMLDLLTGRKSYDK
ncbi:hypothetical protein RIF29_27124 [Crotalaria pallida]|uniref:Protein kinase domain-containing protein n=1 Tax=Crotalaria pallida TaxID=3830 RepID=A0AAN9EP50_CROPI